MPKKITLFISELIPGGAIKQIINLAEVLKEDFDVTLLTWFKVPNEHYKIPEGVYRYVLKNSETRKKNIIITLGKILETRKFIKHFKPDVTISFLHEINAWHILSVFDKKSVKKIISVREFPGFNERNFRSIIYKALTSKADLLVCQTDRIKNWLVVAGYKPKIVIIPNFISIPNLIKNSTDLVPKDQVPYILTIATKVNQKGLDLLIQAYERVTQVHSNIPLKIVGLGDPVEFNKVQNLTANYNVSQQVIVEGYVKDIEEIYSGALFYVLSSRFEGIPNVLLEAMSFKLPIISFDCPTGPREILENGKLGILVEPLNVEALSTAMLLMINNPGLRLKFVKLLGDSRVDNTREISKLWKKHIC
jgi:GalNAc-alpha-(1->4)-GalNAc-alpha-(1->3)-diNAcBac-PP-undecaprenol alpha-1,4-N-acetyl-D-galactosaminyltransferase